MVQNCTLLDQLLAPADLEAAKRLSWQRIFDLDWQEPDFAEPREDKRIQAVMWRFELADVKRAQHFVAR